MVTVYDVANRAGVSIATVSRALNDRSRISAETRRRVIEIAHELGYEPNDVARSLVGKSTQTIALLLPDITNPYFPELVKGVQTITDQRGHLLLLCHNADDEEKALQDLVTLRRKQVDGVILVAGALSGERFAEAAAGLPVVVMDREIALPHTALVAVDHRDGARKATEYLLSLGHRRIAHVTGPPQLSVTAARRAGWEDALRAAGFPPDERLIVPGNFLEDGGWTAGRELLAREIDFSAVFTANDLTAIGLLAMFTEHGIPVPQQVSVVGFDGIHLAAYTSPTLTTVAQPIFALGQRAADLLLDQLEAAEAETAEPPSPTVHLLDTTLVVRDSTARPGSAEVAHD
ncbi:LacI family DNA-binding transcriptional regulator [Natronosporangium hydrolyticum]|uniref:LacI family DNA-binding transcriptional regulator n=1 Tax=Natronosporangium hydrolyticum TaxID=2811111 RepID=A0A895YMS3_9ACTN|nr:LacI family DNA-binding transcriptional regulator [Natronosporangium hydrolyticum]QSB16769.1 LacI family DNA-binding transcriptional regulator [Natronosporangium hydrolyticum]